MAHLPEVIYPQSHRSCGGLGTPPGWLSLVLLLLLGSTAPEGRAGPKDTDEPIVGTPIVLAGGSETPFSREPFVQGNTSTNVTILWRTKTPSATHVEFGTTRDLGRSVANSELVTHHEITLEGLSPDTAYLYRVRHSGAEDQADLLSSMETFRTFKTNGSVRFVFVADTGQSTAPQFLTARVMASLMPDLVLHGGDIIYGGFTDENADSRIFAQYLNYSGQMRSTPFFFTLGNHDLNCCEGNLLDEWNPTNFVMNAPHFLSTFHHPTNSATGTEHFYSFDHGDVHFVSLFNPWFVMYEFTTNRLQYQWFTNDLAQSTKPWKVVFFHHPLASSGAHALDDYNTNGIPDQYDILRTIGTAASKYGVQLILSGHEHNYERFSPIGGFHAVVSGGGGAGLHSMRKRHPLSSQYLSMHNCVNIEIKGDTATVQAVSTNGTILDNWVIQREVPKDRLYHAAWNTPGIESTAANDGDGNIEGQAFDFLGEPILGRHGNAANLGWFYVNNDSTNLYLGIASAMIPEAANLFLFLGVPGLSGTSSLVGIGNGTLDPGGEGADGLDCLENLSFSGFNPAVGILLGDEFADRTLPDFKRPGLAVATGQGVVYLRKTLPPVPEVRIQQYNRSPQSNAASLRLGGAGLEQNADFMEISIPLSALGNLSPGDTIQVAGLVGLAGFNLTTMTRLLDTAVLGTSLETTAENLTSLAPVRVRLANPIELDTDGDGLPDTWEIAHGLKPDSATGSQGALGDPDQDGVSNLEEYLANTDPQDPVSLLRLRLSLAGGNRVRLEWPIVPGNSYLLEATTGLGDSDTFQPIRRVRSNNRTQLLDAAVTDEPTATIPLSNRLYRVRLEP